MKTGVWGLTGAAAMLLAGPASALSLEEFFALPPTFAASSEAIMFHDALTDELGGFSELGGDLEVYGAAFGGLVSGTGTSLFGPTDFDGVLFGDDLFGTFVDFDVAQDESAIRVLFETTEDAGDQTGDYFGLVISFDLGDSLEALLLDGVASATLNLYTAPAPDAGVIPLPAPLALLGLGIAALGVAARRRRGA